MDKRARDLSGVSFTRALVHLWGSDLGLSTSLRPHLPIPSHLGIGFQNMNSGGTQTFKPQHSGHTYYLLSRRNHRMDIIAKKPDRT